ncbi:DUF3592 domain-containing protein [Deinococcus soli (ex Cha et al. 2016)]|uniref:DUF3592 domain-containing protein n=1 Tax=Deinococcus soli (ex Cha et al. 2016) TaxID=1309411 RepID=UPI00286BCDFB|nr:DUF3592 domain-containing protein [Deinococcus soli (ex Cha et al. 2016)]
MPPLLLGAAGIGFIGHGVLILTGRVPPSPARQTVTLNRVGSSVLLGSGLFLISSFLLVLPGTSVVNAIRSRSWTSVEARVTKVSSLSHSCAVTYSYDVNGRTYQSDRMGWNVFNKNRDEGPECAALGDDRQPEVGETIQVLYDPSNPQQAVRRPDLPGSSLFGMVWGTVFTSMLVFMLVQLWRQ